MTSSKKEFTRVSRMGFTATMRGVRGAGYSTTLAGVLKNAGNLTPQQQNELLYGIVTAWNTLAPEQALRCASQFHSVALSPWLSPSHMPSLLEVSAKIGFFVEAHNARDAAGTMAAALGLRPYLDILRYVYGGGRDAAKAQADVKPAILRLAPVG